MSNKDSGERPLFKAPHNSRQDAQQPIDRDWFAQNPRRSYRLRSATDAETAIPGPEPAGDTFIFAAVHQVFPGFRIRHIIDLRVSEPLDQGEEKARNVFNTATRMAAR